jgi:hypothetical protein
MKTLRFARECVYIYLLKRRPDANECILHGENTNAQRERESVGEITPFLCESSSLNVRHTFDTFSRENVRERRKSEQTKLRCGKAEHADARKRIEGRVTTHSLQNVNAAIPRWKPSGPGKRRVRDVQGDVFEVFTGTTLCSLMFDVKTRWYHALTHTKLFFFRALKMMTLLCKR